MANEYALSTGERAQRKLLLTVAEWSENNTTVQEVLGARTEDSAIEFNADSETVTDILGISYTDVNKTEPVQTLDPAYIIGGKKLGEYLSKAALENDINAYNGKFTIYIVCMWLGDDGEYYAVKHTGCSAIPTSIGGDSYVSLPYEIHLSNAITKGTAAITKADGVPSSLVFTPPSNNVVTEH